MKQPSPPVRVLLYAGLGVVLVALLAPRGWEGDSTGQDAASGLLFLGGVLLSTLILTVVVIAAESVVRARERRESELAGPPPTSSWYD